MAYSLLDYMHILLLTIKQVLIFALNLSVFLYQERRILCNQVTYCQYNLFVDKEDNQFKAWSDALIASGYAYMLLDIFNSAGADAKNITLDSFADLEIGNMLSMNRQNGFYQMINIMQKKL